MDLYLLNTDQGPMRPIAHIHLFIFAGSSHSLVLGCDVQEVLRKQ